MALFLNRCIVFATNRPTFSALSPCNSTGHLQFSPGESNFFDANTMWDVISDVVISLLTTLFEAICVIYRLRSRFMFLDITNASDISILKIFSLHCAARFPERSEMYLHAVLFKSTTTIYEKLAVAIICTPVWPLVHGNSIKVKCNPIRYEVLLEYYVLRSFSIFHLRFSSILAQYHEKKGWSDGDVEVCDDQGETTISKKNTYLSYKVTLSAIPGARDWICGRLLHWTLHGRQLYWRDRRTCKHVWNVCELE